MKSSAWANCVLCGYLIMVYSKYEVDVEEWLLDM